MADIFDLTGRHALVTGSSSGLGAHFARRLAQAGAKVTLAARRLPALDLTVTELAANGRQVQAVGMDVTSNASVEAAFAAAEQAFGPVQIVVNNAGVTSTGSALSLDEADWDAVIDTNLKGMWLCAQAGARRMVEHRIAGSIINIASILGLRVAGGVAPYAISKAGVIQLTKALALEWARHKIRVNALAPGYIETELNAAFFQSEPGQALIKRIPQRRLGQAYELDGALLLLAGDAGAYITGSVIAVDGGHLVSSL